MIGFGWVGDRRQDSDDLHGQRNAALIRGGIAFAVVLALLVILLSGGESEKAVSDDLFAEPVRLPTPEPLPPLLQRGGTDISGPVEDQTAVSELPVETVDEEQAKVARVEYPAPIMVENAETVPETSSLPAPQPRRPAVPPPAAQRPTPPAKPATKPATKPAAASKPAADKQKTAASGSAYRVVIGDFLEPAAANNLCDKLMNTGYTLVMQHRVVVGPYTERSKAEADISKLQREQQMRGMVVNAPGGGGLMVQLGVFSEAANAQKMLSKLVAAGYPGQVHMRIMTNTFADKQTAEAALAKLQLAGSVNGVVVAAP